MSPRALIIAVALSAPIAATAGADTITAKFTSSLSKSVNVTRFDDTHNVTTATYLWTRQDSPGPGVDSIIPQTFRTYCVDYEQYMTANSNITYTTVDPLAYGFSPAQVLALSRLWDTYQPIVDTANESAAFQLAIWEIIDDASPNLSANNFRVNSPSDVKSLASTWLTNINSPGYSGGASQLIVIAHPNKQDQITVVPAPSTAALAGLGGLVALRRRRRVNA